MAGPLDLMNMDASPAGQNSPLTGMLQALMANRPQAPTPQERQGALNDYTNALRNAGADNRDTVDMLMQGGTMADNPMDPFQFGVAALHYKQLWQTQQREAARAREVAAAQAAYQDAVERQKEAMLGGGGAGAITQLVHAALNPIQNVGGNGIARLTGQVVVPKDFVPQAQKIELAVYQEAIKRGADHGTAEQLARQAVQSFLGTLGPGITGARGSLMPTQADAASQAAPGTPPVEVAPTVPRASAIPALQKEAAAAEAAGDAGRALELQKAIQALSAAPTASPAEVQRFTSPTAVPIASPAGGMPPVGFAEGEKEKQKGFQDQYKTMGDAYGKDSDAAITAQQAYRETLKTLNEYVKAGGVPSVIAPYKMKLQNLLNGIGVDLGPDASQLTAAEILNKMNSQLGAQFAKSINSNKATQQEVQIGMRASPGLEMPEGASREILAYFDALANLSKRKATNFTDWRDKFGTVDPSTFHTYWQLHADYPTAIAKLGLTPTKIREYADRTGKSPIDVLTALKPRLEAAEKQFGEQ